METIEVGKLYRHFKGNYYLILDIATHSETRESYVVYKALYGDFATYIRPYDMFLEKIYHKRSDNITGQKYRFERIDKI